jgi:putative copper export protein
LSTIRKKNLFLVTILAVSLLLSTSVTSCKEHPAQRAGATHGTGEGETVATAERTLKTFNEIIAIAVLVGGLIFLAYCLGTNNKTRKNRARRRGSPPLKDGKQVETLTSPHRRP